MDGDNEAPGLLDEFFEEISYSLELGDTTLQDMDIDLHEDEDEDKDEDLVIASVGLLDDLFEQIHSALKMHHLSTSSSDNNEDECRSLQFVDGQFDYANEIVAERDTLTWIGHTMTCKVLASTIKTMEVDNESIENINKMPPTIPPTMEPQITELLMFDEQQTCVSWPSELLEITCSSSEKQLWPSDAEEETMDVLASSNRVETVSEPMPKKRKSFQLALERMLLNVERTFCCCSNGDGHCKRRATDTSSE